MLHTILRYISPASLRKYGLHAVLFFFMALTLWLLVNDRQDKKGELLYQKQKNEELQRLLIEQLTLKSEQQMIKSNTDTTIVKIDTIKDLSTEIATKAKKLRR